MKTNIRNMYRWGIFLVLNMILVSCSKEEGPGGNYSGEEYEQIFDVKISFDSLNKPPVGDELKLNLYYSDINGKNRSKITPDFEFDVELSQDKIDGGFEIPIEFYESKEEVYIGAHIDIDQSGDMSPDDFVVFYKDISLEEVESGSRKSVNLAEEEDGIELMVNQKVKQEHEDEDEDDEDDEVVDYDGNVYKTVVIGEQEWFAENLRVTHYRNGDSISTGLDKNGWSDIKEGAYAIYPYEEIEGVDSEEEVANKYGLLYNWYVVDNPNRVCPEGWKVPSDNDWKELERAIGMSEEDSNKSNWRGGQAPLLMTVDYWKESPGKDEFDFGALPSGARNVKGEFERNGIYAFYWTSTPSSTKENNAIRRVITFKYDGIARLSTLGNDGESMRCIKEN